MLAGHDDTDTNRVTAHDVVAITLRALLYYLARNQKCSQKLRDEITEADQTGRLSSPCKYTEAASLPYLSVHDPV